MPPGRFFAPFLRKISKTCANPLQFGGRTFIIPYWHILASYKDRTLIADNGGSVEKVEEWGKRRLAYAIDYKTEGYYVLVNFQAEAELPKELERNLQISDSVIRYQVIKQLERKAGVKPRPVRVAPAAPVAPAAEAPVETPAAE